MSNLSGFIKKLKEERDQAQRQLSALNAALVAFAGVYKNSAGPAQRKLSAKGRARIAAAQRARWAKAKGQAVTAVQTSKAGKRTMSAAARQRIAAAQRARWARVKAAKQ